MTQQINKLKTEEARATNRLGLTVPPEGDPTESKNARFRRLANQRAAILTLNLKALGRLSGSQYEYSLEEAEILISRLTAEFAFLVEQLRHGAQSSDSRNIF